MPGTSRPGASSTRTMFSQPSHAMSAETSRRRRIGGEISGIATFPASATQAWVNPYLGPRILDALAAGASAQSALRDTLAAEVDRELRQVGVVDRRGESAAFTGDETDPWKGHRTGLGFAVQGNMLVGQE